jgi:hypothetical protein
MSKSHIKGDLTWSNGVYVGYKVTNEFLFLFLEDGSERKMMRSWGDDTLITLKNIEKLEFMDSISYATWTTYKSDEWFCDVRRIKNEK